MLKGYDQLLNLVLDEATEYLRGESVFVCFSPRPPSPGRARLQRPHVFLHTHTHAHTPHNNHPPTDKDDPLRITDATRVLGLCVCRGTAVMAVAPAAGAEELPDNPFAAVVETGGE